MDKLAEAGWVAREADPSDRRVSIVALTDAGRQVMQAGVDALVNAGFGPIAGLDEDQRRGLSQLLAALRGSPTVVSQPLPGGALPGAPREPDH